MVRESRTMVRERGDGEGEKWSTVNFDFCSELTFDVVMYNVVVMEIIHSLQHTPQDVLHVVHYKLKHGGTVLVFHQNIGESSLTQSVQVGLNIPTHSRVEVVAVVAVRA